MVANISMFLWFFNWQCCATINFKKHIWDSSEDACIPPEVLKPQFENRPRIYIYMYIHMYIHKCYTFYLLSFYHIFLCDITLLELFFKHGHVCVNVIIKDYSITESWNPPLILFNSGFNVFNVHFLWYKKCNAQGQIWKYFWPAPQSQSVLYLLMSDSIEFQASMSAMICLSLSQTCLKRICFEINIWYYKCWHNLSTKCTSGCLFTYSIKPLSCF